MLRVELTKQLLRVRSLVALAALAAVPVAAGLGTASHAGGPERTSDRAVRGVAVFGAEPRGGQPAVRGHTPAATGRRSVRLGARRR